MRDKLGETVRLQHIKEAIDYVERFTAGKTQDDLNTDPMMRFAVIKQLEVIGEAANNLSEATKEKMNEIEWWKIKGFRNISVHEYWRTSTAIVWRIVEAEIPLLKAAIEKFLSA